MNALTLSDRLQTLEQECQDSSSTQVTRPRFTRARRVSDLRIAFKADAFNDAELAIEQVRRGRGSDPLGGVAISEITAFVGATKLRAYVDAAGRMTVPSVLGMFDLERRITEALAAAGSAAR